MSKKSNEFQKLVLSIYSNLAEKEARVTESGMVTERGRKLKREIDILIEQEIAGETIRIGIECRGRSRKDDVMWIDGIVGKFLDLDLNHKIAVSGKGFSAGAIEKAAAHNIKTYTLKEATEIDWKNLFIKPGMAYIKFDIQFAKYRVITDSELLDHEVARQKTAILKNGIRVPLDKYLFDAYTKVAQPLMMQEYKNKRSEIYKTVADLSNPIPLQANIDLPGVRIIDENGNEIGIKAVHYLSVGVSTVTKAKLQHMIMDGKEIHVSDGTLNVDQKDVKVNIIQDKNKMFKFRFSFS